MGEIPVFHNSGIPHFEAKVQFLGISAQKTEQIPNSEYRVSKKRVCGIFEEFLIFLGKAINLVYC